MPLWASEGTLPLRLTARLVRRQFCSLASARRRLMPSGTPHAFPYNGTDLVYCSGPTVADGWGGSDDSGLKCDMTGGSSGGGWFSPFNEATGEGTLVSVNSFEYFRGPYAKNMFGPLFDADTQATYAAAQGASGNTVE